MQIDHIKNTMQLLIIDKYIIKEIFQTLIAVIVVLLLIFLGRHFARYLADAVAGNLPAELIFKLLATLTLSSLVLLLPFAFFISVLLAYGRLYKDSEMTVLAACGVGINRFLVTTLSISFIFAIVVAIMSLYIAPWAVEQGLKLRDRADSSPEIAGTVAGQFKELGADARVFYVEKISPESNLMRNVFIFDTGRQDRGKDQGIDIFSSLSGYQYIDDQTGEKYLVLVDGFRYQGVPGQANFKIHSYKKGAIRIEKQAIAPRSRKRNAVPLYELLNSSDTRDIAELQWRLSMPISVILLALLAVLLSHTTPRQGRYAKLFVALFVYIVYNNLLGASQSWVQQGSLPATIGLWWVHIAFLLLIFFLLVKHYHLSYLKNIIRSRSIS